MTEAKTPPGIAKNPSHATCKIKKYKHCYNLEHVCPKFCPDECTVECVSCKPICVGASSPTPPDDSGSSPNYPSPPTQTPPSSTPTPTPYPPTPSTPSPTTPSPTPSTPSPYPPTPSTPSPTTPSPTPSTPSPTTPSPSTPFPTPPTPSTPSPTTPSPTKPSPTPSTPSPTTPSPSTPSPTPPTPSPTTPSPSKPSPTLPTPSPSTPSPTTPSPKPPSTTPSPSTPSPKPPNTPTSPSPSTPSPSTPYPTPPSTTPTSPSPSTPTTPSPTTPSPKPPTSTPSPTTPSTPSPSTPSPTTPSPSTPSTPSPSSPTPPSSTPSSPSSHTPYPSPPPDQSEANGAKRARCRNKNYPQCYNTEHVCPRSCPGGCEVDCVTCKPVCKCDQPGAVCQDPRFIGGDGITFYFHGKKDHDFCLLSDPNLHINAHFIGKRNSNMKRDFTWVQSIGILFGKHQLYVGALKTATWDDSVDRLAITFDGEPISLLESEGANWQSKSVPSVLVLRGANTNNVMVEVEGSFRITAKVVPITEEDSRIHNYGITKEDSFAHLDLGFKFFSLSNEVSGILGQTYRPDYVSKVNIGAKMPIMGGEKEFKTSNILAVDCAVARFKGIDNEGEGSLESLELPSLSCASGMDGQGVVCKK